MDKYLDNMDEEKSIGPSDNSKGKRVFKIVSNITFVYGKAKDGKRRKDMKPLEGDTFKKMSVF